MRFFGCVVVCLVGLGVVKSYEIFAEFDFATAEEGTVPEPSSTAVGLAAGRY